MKHVPLNDYLSEKSNWPKRLLGWEDYQIKRSRGFVEKEYDRDRYEQLLPLHGTEIEAYKVAEFESLGMPMDAPLFLSLGEEVFRTDVRTGRLLWYSVIEAAVQRFATGTVCELGCGFGFNLHKLGRGSYGGDYSANAVKIGRHLGLDVSPFNYYECGDYKLVRPDSTVLTVHSVEQLPSATPFLDGIESVKRNVREVIQLEPCLLPERNSLLGMIRNRYNELIDHNHDLVSLLRSRRDVEIVYFKADVFGLHPLNSTNLIVWRFL